jgi:protein phosphatase 1 regulatory subunit 37
VRVDRRGTLWRLERKRGSESKGEHCECESGSIMDVHAPVASSSTISNTVLPLPPAGKSILKKAPPPQPRFSINNLRNILNVNAPDSPSSDDKPLKRAHFILPSLQTVYTFSIANPPSAAGLQEEKRSVEEREQERRRTVVRGNSFLQDKDAWWSMERVDSFYRECCQGREELPNSLVSSALLVRPCYIFIQ